MIKQIPSKEIKDYIKNNPKCVLLDVRTEEEWNSDGKPDAEKIGIITYFLTIQFIDKSFNQNFSEEFEKLLLQMLKKSPWREALSKAISMLLESGWMDSKLGINVDELSKSLLPHQIDGLKRALWVIENKGAVLVADATGSGKTKLGTWLCKTGTASPNLVRRRGSKSKISN